MGKISSSIYEFLAVHVPEEDILFEEPMCRHTTFRVGGEAQFFVRVSKREQLLHIIPYLKQVETPFFIL